MVAPLGMHNEKLKVTPRVIFLQTIKKTGLQPGFLSSCSRYALSMQSSPNSWRLLLLVLLDELGLLLPDLRELPFSPEVGVISACAIPFDGTPVRACPESWKSAGDVEQRGFTRQRAHLVFS